MLQNYLVLVIILCFQHISYGFASWKNLVRYYDYELCNYCVILMNIYLAITSLLKRNLVCLKLMFAYFQIRVPYAIRGSLVILIGSISDYSWFLHQNPYFYLYSKLFFLSYWLAWFFHSPDLRIYQICLIRFTVVI